MKLGEHFDSAEFRCKDGSEHTIDPRLIEMLERVRKSFGKPVTITSGYRSPSWNNQVGGASHSYHVRGMAADIQVPGVSARDVSAFCDRHFPAAVVGAYRHWTHLDCRGYRARWGFPKRQAPGRGVASFAGGAAALGLSEAAHGVLIETTRWALVRGLAEITVAWAWRALIDWRVSPEELLDLAHQLLDFADRLQTEAAPPQEHSADA